MRTIILSLMFLASFSFTGNAKESTTIALANCTPCGAYSDGVADAGGDGHAAYMHCFENLNPCPIQLETVIIKA